MFKNAFSQSNFKILKSAVSQEQLSQPAGPFFKKANVRTYLTTVDMNLQN